MVSTPSSEADTQRVVSMFLSRERRTYARLAGYAGITPTQLPDVFEIQHLMDQRPDAPVPASILRFIASKMVGKLSHRIILFIGDEVRDAFGYSDEMESLRWYGASYDGKTMAFSWAWIPSWTVENVIWRDRAYRRRVYEFLNDMVPSSLPRVPPTV